MTPPIPILRLAQVRDTADDVISIVPACMDQETTAPPSVGVSPAVVDVEMASRVQKRLRVGDRTEFSQDTDLEAAAVMDLCEFEAIIDKFYSTSRKHGSQPTEVEAVCGDRLVSPQPPSGKPAQAYRSLGSALRNASSLTHSLGKPAHAYRSLGAAPRTASSYRSLGAVVRPCTAAYA